MPSQDLGIDYGDERDTIWESGTSEGVDYEIERGPGGTVQLDPNTGEPFSEARLGSKQVGEAGTTIEPPQDVEEWVRRAKSIEDEQPPTGEEDSDEPITEEQAIRGCIEGKSFVDGYMGGMNG